MRTRVANYVEVPDPETPAPLRAHIRWMIRRDMDDVLETERSAFPGGNAWTQDEFLACLRQRNCIGMVAENADARVIGFMVYELNLTTITVLNFAVHRDYHRRGVGGQMARKLIAKLDSHRRYGIDLTVGDRNLPAHLFFRAMGFRAVGVNRSAFPDGSDGYEFAYRVRGEARP